MKKLFIILIALVMLFVSARNTLAIYDPLSVPNNRTGIHIFSEKDLDDAAKLVNAEGGNWGYVTIVITEAERDHDRWQQIFDKMRRLHLIPIIRLATKANGPVWEKPNQVEINNWTAFLNSLNWVIQNRYIVISNEPNHDSEWGGSADPGEYATYLKEFSAKLKAASNDFFILTAALDASATYKGGAMEEDKFIKEMLKKEPDVFDHIDGWSSHSYPNPDFSGNETATGQKTISGFLWETFFLKSLGINKEFPIFITETGWSNEKLSESEIAGKLAYAYQNVWNDKNIVAVTPFILNYAQTPFSQFSWKNSDGKFNMSYSKVRGLIKTKGEPIQIVKGEILAAIASPIVLSGSGFLGAILAKNTGQSIWNSKDIYLGEDSDNFTLKSYAFNEIEPLRLGLTTFSASAPQKPGQYKTSLFFKNVKNGKVSNSFSLETLIFKIDGDKFKNVFRGLTSLLGRLLSNKK